MTKEDLEKKVLSFKNGNQDVFNDIYDKTYKIIYMIIYGIVRNKAASEDLLQDTYRTAIQNIEKYNESNFIAWISTIAKHLALNYYNKNKKETVSDFVEDKDADTLIYEDKTEYGLFNKAQEILSEEDYKILIMIVVSGFKRREIAKMMDMPISTVSYRYKEAINKLKKYLKEVS